MARLRSCLLLVALTACATTHTSQVDREIAATLAQVRQTTLPSGWRVDCLTDEVHAIRTCFAGNFGTALGGTSASIPFRVVFVDAVGPEVQPGFSTYPGRTPTVRVDSNPPVYDMRSADLINQMKHGSIARAEYHVWPTGAARMTLDLTGFAEALDSLLARVRARQ